MVIFLVEFSRLQLLLVWSPILMVLLDEVALFNFSFTAADVPSLVQWVPILGLICEDVRCFCCQSPGGFS